MGKARSDSGYYWVDRKLTCNGCKYLNFYKCGCRRNQPNGHVRPLSSYTNGDDYIAILKPPDCSCQGKRPWRCPGQRVQHEHREDGYERTDRSLRVLA